MLLLQRLGSASGSAECAAKQRHMFRQGVQQQPVRWRGPPQICKATEQQPDASTTASNVAHAKVQADKFGRGDVVQTFMQPLPDDIELKLSDITAAVPGLGSHSRVLDVGSGTGCLIPHIQSRGVQDITAVDLSRPMLQQLQTRFPIPSVCGNDPGVRTWCGDFVHLPNYYGPVDAIFMNAVFGNFYNTRDALLRASMLLVPGGHLVISHPLGRSWHTQLHQDSPATVPHQLPDQQQLETLIRDLPLTLTQCRDEPGLYIAVLQVPPGYQLPSAPVAMESVVVSGFGRGSRQLGVPTANMDPQPLQQQLQRLAQGVYFGWAQIDAPADSPPIDSAVHKMVMNVGRRPTVNEGDEAATVEVHILHKYSHEEFYGVPVRVVITGFIRPEIKFSGLQQLLARIRTDIGLAKTQLDEPAAAALKVHEIFRQDYCEGVTPDVP